MKQENSKDFELKEIIMLKPLTINIIVILVVATFFSLYYAVMGINFKLSFAMITFGLIVLGIILILKAVSSTVNISFNENSLVIKTNGKINQYRKNNITGLYSINYNSSKSSRVAFEMLFDNGASIYFSDIEFNDRKDTSKNKQLMKLLNLLTAEIDLPECKKVKSLNLHRMGQYFYYKTNKI